MRRKRNRFSAAASLVALMAMCSFPLPSDGCRSCAAKKMEKALQQKHTAESAISLESILQNIHELSRQQNCISPYHAVAVPFSTERFVTVRDKIDLVAKILGDYNPQNDTDILKTALEETCRSEDNIYLGRMLWIGNGTLLSPQYYAEARRSPKQGDKNHELTEFFEYQASNKPWLHEKVIERRSNASKWRGPYPGEYSYGQWTEPYFSCDVRKWLITYTAFMYAETKVRKQHRKQNGEIMVGLFSADVDVMDMDINQCDTLWKPDNGSSARPQVEAFLGTHKCHNDTSECIFTPGHGWVKGAYNCRCRHGFYSATRNHTFNGSLVELAWKEKNYVQSPSYDMLYVCKRCAPGCSTCVNDSPCLSHYNWAFRISLLTISVMCILLTAVLACYIYRYRKLKVIKVASPIFLCITLAGCAIMYLEMAAIFPVLDVYSCVATKWTRNMGFCITYSALLLKTWRVSLTYRVKSAHKLKLTDKQLLQWLFPILLVMAIYLGTWTISAPPQAIYIVDWYGLKFKQCDYSWWDHSLAIGEFLFLLWGIRVCYSVRNAESFFNEAKHISWAIYNITIVNIIMVLIHLVILPSAGPDIKYLFGFIRTQLSTTVTIILIFGPKFYRVIKGQGDSWDNRARARGVTASFSLNGVGLVHEETTDLYQENEELKEEIQKLAAQIEFMKIVHMEMNNRHLKPKHGSFFNQPATTQSPIIKSAYMRFESTDSPGSRISPAAELVSERV